jgi:hypothetical protein
MLETIAPRFPHQHQRHPNAPELFIVTQDAALSPCSGFDAHGSSLATETGSSRALASADRSSPPN